MLSGRALEEEFATNSRVVRTYQVAHLLLYFTMAVHMKSDKERARDFPSGRRVVRSGVASQRFWLISHNYEQECSSAPACAVISRLPPSSTCATSVCCKKLPRSVRVFGKTLPKIEWVVNRPQYRDISGDRESVLARCHTSCLLTAVDCFSCSCVNASFLTYPGTVYKSVLVRLHSRSWSGGRFAQPRADERPHIPPHRYTRTCKLFYVGIPLSILRTLLVL